MKIEKITKNKRFFHESLLVGKNRQQVSLVQEWEFEQDIWKLLLTPHLTCVRMSMRGMFLNHSSSPDFERLLKGMGRKNQCGLSCESCMIREQPWCFKRLWRNIRVHNMEVFVWYLEELVYNGEGIRAVLDEALKYLKEKKC